MVIKDRPPSCCTHPRLPHPYSLYIFWNGFGTAFLQFLGPSWLPTCPQNRPKSMPRAIPNPSQFASCFRCFFLLFFYRFWCRLGTPESLKIELSPRRRAYFAYFAYLLAGRHLGTNLASILVGFGDQVEPKLAPSCQKNRSKKCVQKA